MGGVGWGGAKCVKLLLLLQVSRRRPPATPPPPLTSLAQSSTQRLVKTRCLVSPFSVTLAHTGAKPLLCLHLRAHTPWKRCLEQSEHLALRGGGTAVGARCAAILRKLMPPPWQRCARGDARVGWARSHAAARAPGRDPTIAAAHLAPPATSSSASAASASREGGARILAGAQGADAFRKCNKEPVGGLEVPRGGRGAMEDTNKRPYETQGLSTHAR